MIELRRLRYLVVLANRLSYSRAAGELGLSQSALTRAIQSLERDVNMRLFDRDQSGVRLTEQGRSMVEKAEALLVNASEFNRQVNEAARGSEGRVRFGMSALAAHGLLAPVLGERLATNPGFSHEAFVRETESLSLMLAKGELEFLLCEEWNTGWPLMEGLPLRTEPVGELRAGLIVRSGHPADGTGALGGSWPLLVDREASRFGNLAGELAQRFGMTLQMVEEIGSAVQLVQATDAVWLAPPRAVARHIQGGTLRDLGLPAGLRAEPMQLSLYSLARRTLSPAAVELQQAFRSSLSS